MDIGILVLSCDRYCDLWPPYFAAFFDQWSDCPYPVYLAANELEFRHARVTTLKSGPDLDWSSSVLAVLRQMPHTHVLTFFEDLFFLRHIDTASVIGACEWAVSSGARYVRMRPVPRPEEPTSNAAIGRVREDSLYRTALHAAVTDRTYLMSILRPGESAWSFEVWGPARTARERRFFATYADLFPATNAVEKGKWYPEILEQMRQRRYVAGPLQRGVWSREEVARRSRWAKLRRLARLVLPIFMRPIFHRVLWKWYRASGAVK